METAAPIANVVEAVLKNIASARKSKTGRIASGWEEIVGKRISKHTKPCSIRKSRLTVNVESSCWLYEICTLYKDEITSRVRQQAGDDAIEVRFRVGKVD
jgi:predicted nucleic acid-binding Zn ribbon protein